MSEDEEKPLMGADAEAQPTRPNPETGAYRPPADMKGAPKLPAPAEPTE